MRCFITRFIIKVSLLDKLDGSCQPYLLYTANEQAAESQLCGCVLLNQAPHHNSNRRWLPLRRAPHRNSNRSWPLHRGAQCRSLGKVALHLLASVCALLFWPSEDTTF